MSKKKASTTITKESDIQKKYVSCCEILFLLSAYSEVIKKRTEIEQISFATFTYSFLMALRQDDSLCARCTKFYLTLKEKVNNLGKKRKTKKES
ncbi:protein of unknown function [endosymbiont DhMRE of Dentiscutata heterogama]|nr:protein of unknown function [endosymbiont DhMRE of Dentiscutata heterogama]